MRVFVAGSTGASGTAFRAVAEAKGLDLILHLRPRTAPRSRLATDRRARVLELSDTAALAAAMAGCDAVVSFVGTMRSRFAAGDTYASSDVASARELVAGARAAGVGRFLLLSSLGAGGVGSYLKMKRECERIVEQSGLSWTIFRPSALVTPEGTDAGEHGMRRAPPGAGALFGVLRAVPGLRGWSDDVRPVPLDVVARAFVSVLERPADSQRLAGRDLWRRGA